MDRSHSLRILIKVNVKDFLLMIEPPLLVRFDLKSWQHILVVVYSEQCGFM